MNANDYARLKWADDPRWTNAVRRDAQKALAAIGGREAESRRAADAAADAAIANHLAAVKKSVAAYADAAQRAVVHRNMEHVLSVVPVVDRAAYERMGTADAVDRSLTEKLARHRQRLIDCRNRCADKVARMAVLRARLAEARSLTSGRCAASDRGTATATTALAARDKSVDALRLSNQQAARARDLIADTMAMTDALNGQLATDVRQQAAGLVELLALGTSARQEAAAFNRQYCQAKDEHQAIVRRQESRKWRIKSKVIALESNRRNIINDVVNGESDESMEFKPIKVNKSSTSSSSTDFESVSSNYSHTTTDAEVMPLMDWITTGPMDAQIYRKKEDDSKTSQLLDNDVYKIDDLSSDNESYTFPEEKVNLYRHGNLERSKAMEAVEYVCDTLGFSSITEVLEYFSTVKNVEIRIKQMIGLRKNLLEIAHKSLECATEVETECVNCLPDAVFRLDADIERVQREGLDVQSKQFDAVSEEIFEYCTLFNDLWFYLDGLAGKLDRCQVPVVRKYQINKGKRNMCADAINDVHLMLEGLELVFDDENDGRDNRDAGSRLDAMECVREKSELDAIVYNHGGRGGHKTISGWNTAAAACRKLVAVLRTKVKACLVHIGGDFNAADDQQLVARAHFEYNQQFHLQKFTMDQNERALRRALALEDPSSLAAGGRTATDSKTAAAAAGILTREQAKQQSDDIVKWSTAVKDTDDAKRSRKPISFRKSRIVV